jgi:hypothetical protein
MSQDLGSIRFRKDAVGQGYLVYSDCMTGEMAFVGYIEKNDRPMLNDRWYGRIPGREKQFSGSTRMDVAERMVRA